MLFASDKQVITTRLCGLGISPRDAGNLVKDILTWERCSGSEWTVDRIKSLKILYIRRILNGEKYEPEYISLVGNYPSGPFGRLMKYYPRQTVLMALQVYTTVEQPGKPTQKQLDKFYLSMTKEPSDVSDVNREIMEAIVNHSKPLDPFTRMRRAAASSFQVIEGMQSDRSVSDHGRVRDAFNDIVVRDNNVMSWITSKTRRTPVLTHFGEFRTAKESETNALDHLEYLGYTIGYWRDLIEISPRFQEIVSDSRLLSEYLEEILSFPDFDERYPDDDGLPTDLVGKISFIQEPGLKLRAVANPFRVVQAISFEPAKLVWDVLKTLERQRQGLYVYNQDEGFLQIGKTHERLENAGLTSAYNSIDLSDATNNFPWSTQQVVLKSFMDWKDLMLLDWIAKGSWICPDGEVRRFTVGQPLGAFFSFASFTLAHWAVALTGYYAAQKRGIPLSHPSDHIFIVGDDIVILGDEVAEEYRRLMYGLSVPISPDKTLHSKHMYEFLSRLSINGKELPMSKWRVASPHNIVDLYMRDPGIRATANPFQKEVMEWYAQTPEPLGLGRNPKGIPLNDRIKGFEDEWVRAACSNVSLTGLSSSVSTNPPTPSHLDETYFGRNITSVSCDDFQLKPYGISDSKSLSERIDIRYQETGIEPSLHEQLAAQSENPSLTECRNLGKNLFIPDRVINWCRQENGETFLKLAEAGLLTSKNFLDMFNKLPTDRKYIPSQEDIRSAESFLLNSYGLRVTQRPVSRWDSVKRMYKDYGQL